MSLSSWNQTSSAMFPSNSKRLVRSKSGLKIVAQHERGVTPWSLEEPHWVRDEEVSQCVQCKTVFDFLKRRHHCRRCGKIYCAKCCGSKIQFHRMGFVDPVRICKNCQAVTNAEKTFFETKLKVLFIGAPFHIRSSVSISQDWFLYNCKLATDERFLLFDNHGDEGEELNPIDLCRITKLDDGGNDDLIVITVKENGSDPVEYSLKCPSEPSRKPSVQWISAFREGMKMVFESRSFCRDDLSNQ